MIDWFVLVGTIILFLVFVVLAVRAWKDAYGDTWHGYDRSYNENVRNE